jgi:predicted MFS family arabinose efflux permease
MAQTLDRPCDTAAISTSIERRYGGAIRSSAATVARSRPTGTRATLPRPVAFWTVAATLAFLLFASSAPSPLYVVYQERFGFSAIVLTSVFAVYVLALLIALIFAGSLSDRVGRRPVLVLALLVEAAAMLLFALAGSVEALFAARVVQGLATGVATGALSAAAIDLVPPARAHVGALVSAVAPPVGLAAGALGSGLLIEYGPDPLQLVFWLLAAVFLVATAAIVAMPETVPSRGGWASALRPRVSVPPAARAAFAATAPCMVATWALGGLYLSLGPSLAVSLLHTSSHVVGGLVIVALTGTSALTAVLVRGHAPQRTMIGGAITLTIGVAITLLGLNLEATALFFAGSVIAGAGFGPAFSGALTTVMALAAPTERAGLIAAVYVVSYLGFSLPAIAAGVAVVHVGLLPATNGYGIFVMVLAVTATTLTIVRERRTAGLA